MLSFKIDTREKFKVITLLTENLSANLTEELITACNKVLAEPIKNLVLNFENVRSMELPIAEELVHLRELFYTHDASMVVCSLPENVKNFLIENELLDALNHTPTESEAWDIVQMEEIERELLGDDPEA